MSRSAVVRIWRSFGLQPHRSETFKLSTDPWLVEKVRDIVGLYLNPKRAIVLCVVDKSQVQALDRTQPILPLRPGLPEQRTSDYERHGTTLRPDAGEIHLVLDNYGTHNTPRVVRWFARHPRYQLHFTPTSGSWVNQIERWLAAMDCYGKVTGPFFERGLLTVLGDMLPLLLAADPTDGVVRVIARIPEFMAHLGDPAASQAAALARARQRTGRGHPFWWGGFIYLGNSGDK